MQFLWQVFEKVVHIMAETPTVKFWISFVLSVKQLLKSKQELKELK